MNVEERNYIPKGLIFEQFSMASQAPDISAQPMADLSCSAPALA